MSNPIFVTLDVFQGNHWLQYCIPCHKTNADCCRDIELTLFPDEIAVFKAKDPENVVKYQFQKKDLGGITRTIQLWGYNAKTCIFLNKSGLCELQDNGTKPVDCLIYPVNYKNRKLFLDTSCPAKLLGNKNEAKRLLLKKLEQFPDYYNVSYELMIDDVEIDNY